jgi:hypothetical protein
VWGGFGNGKGDFCLLASPRTAVALKGSQSTGVLPAAAAGVSVWHLGGTTSVPFRGRAARVISVRPRETSGPDLLNHTHMLCSTPRRAAMIRAGRGVRVTSCDPSNKRAQEAHMHTPVPRLPPLPIHLSPPPAPLPCLSVLHVGHEGEEGVPPEVAEIHVQDLCL